MSRRGELPRPQRIVDHRPVGAGTFDPTSGLIYSGIEDKLFAVSFVTKASRKDDPTIKKFVSIFQTS
ncbi:MetQ/NlpA family ABC transporter substrate-binding protein, partial [Methylobacterium sp. J-070]|nr:MetQ/NlpA family ABC transporter substrate-binding protein [Methylobacterium sp. J-070]